jgi:hypothetical protein
VFVQLLGMLSVIGVIEVTLICKVFEKVFDKTFCNVLSYFAYFCILYRVGSGKFNSSRR